MANKQRRVKGGLAHLAGGGYATPSHAGMTHQTSSDEHPAPLQDSVLAGMRQWLPDIPGTVGDIGDALSYAARRIAKGQSNATVPSTGWGEAARRAAMGQALSTETSMSAPQEEDIATTIARVLNPAFLVNPAAAGRSVVGGLRAYQSALENPERLARAAKFAAMLPKQQGVIKNKGGNWLTGSVEGALSPLLKSGTSQAQARQALKDRLVGLNLNPSSVDTLTDIDVARQYAFLENPRLPARLIPILDNNDAAHNDFITQKLTKYVKNQMATPEDPIRALAEQGVLHIPPAGQGVVSTVAADRIRAGFPPLGVAENPLAKTWEHAADSHIYPSTVEKLTALPLNAHLVTENPWMSKVDPSTKVYSADKGTEGLGFPHLSDYIQTALNPPADLPAALRLTPEQLGRSGVGDIVKKTSDWNAWMAAKAENTRMAEAKNLPVHKDYPEQGMRWVEIKAPELRDLEARYPNGGPSVHEALEAQLKAEGDAMGHCVGGYTNDVLSGKSRIYSLRDAKNQPHATVEVGPPDMSGVHPLLAEQFAQSVPPRIVQIKGKSNAAPVDKYQPFVQDFVKSGEWSDVGDLGNTGLNKWQGKYLTDEELAAQAKALKDSGDQFAHGGVVHQDEDFGAQLLRHLTPRDFGTQLLEHLNGR